MIANLRVSVSPDRYHDQESAGEPCRAVPKTLALSYPRLRDRISEKQQLKIDSCCLHLTAYPRILLPLLITLRSFCNHTPGSFGV